MSGGIINAYSADVIALALALGDTTATDTGTFTAAWPGTAKGYAVAIAAAQDIAPDIPHTIAITDGIATGGYMTASQTTHWSVDIPFGPTLTSVEVSVTYVLTHGGASAFSEYYGLVSSSPDGLF
jgi:hypothetical protein